MTNRLQWKIIDGPPEWKDIDNPEEFVNSGKVFKEKVRVLFAEKSGVDWVKKAGGVKYGGKKICGHHIYNCTLRPLELVAPPGPVAGPSTSSDVGPSPAPSAAAESSDESEDERGAGPSAAPSAVAGDDSDSD